MSVGGGYIDLIYFLDDDSNGWFVIDENFGFIINIMIFDREGDVKEFNIIVRVIDKVVNLFSGIIFVIIRVEDINDYRLKFNFLEYRVFVFENVYFVFFVVKVNVLDEDIGYNVWMEFMIVFGNNFYVFYIKFVIGDILVLGELDYEIILSYILKINVLD